MSYATALSPDVMPTWFVILAFIALVSLLVVITAPERRRRRADRNWIRLNVPERVRK